MPFSTSFFSRQRSRRENPAPPLHLQGGVGAGLIGSMPGTIGTFGVLCELGTRASGKGAASSCPMSVTSGILISELMSCVMISGIMLPIASTTMANISLTPTPAEASASTLALTSMKLSTARRRDGTD